MVLETVVSIQRLQAGANPNQESYVTILQGVRMHISPASPQITAVMEGVYGNTYQAYTKISGIKMGDQVTISGSNTKYVVKGANQHPSPLPHMELILFGGEH